MTSPRVIEQILDIARWAPSGDNTQPWRFEIVSDSHVVVHGFDTRDHCVYDLDGHPSQIALGALVETVGLAASAHGLEMESSLRTGMPDTQPTLDLRFTPAKDGKGPDRLLGAVRRRSVQRRAMSTRSLTSEQKDALQRSLGSGYRVLWIEGFAGRWAAAALMFRSAKLRLTMPEAYQVHRDVIEWGARYSVDRVPDQALGVDPMTLHLMRFVLQSWTRVKLFNTFLAGTWAPRLQMDLLPGLACAAHFALIPTEPAASTQDYVNAGRRVQRFWLTATDLGLGLQPEVTPLIFSRYFREGIKFSDMPKADQKAGLVANELASLLGETESQHAVFMGRLGAGPEAISRSLRKDLNMLMDKSVGPAEGHPHAPVVTTPVPAAVQPPLRTSQFRHDR